MSCAAQFSTVLNGVWGHRHGSVRAKSKGFPGTTGLSWAQAEQDSESWGRLPIKMAAVRLKVRTQGPEVVRGPEWVCGPSSAPAPLLGDPRNRVKSSVICP